MTIASQQLHAAAVPVTTPVTIYTVPSGKRTILKSIAVYNGWTSAQVVELYFYDGGTLLMAWPLYLGAIGTNADRILEAPWMVLLDGQIIKIVSDHSGAYAMLSGAELTV